MADEAAADPEVPSAELFDKIVNLSRRRGFAGASRIRQRAPQPTNPLPFSRGNSFERVEAPPAAPPERARGQGPTPDPAQGQQAQAPECVTGPGRQREVPLGPIDRLHGVHDEAQERGFPRPVLPKIRRNRVRRGLVLN